MSRKILALIIIVLFIATVFNSSIVAEKDISRTTIVREIISTREEFDKLDYNVIQNCTETGDYSKLLKFMGNGSKIVFNAHINATGKGLYLGKRFKYIKLAHPIPRFRIWGIFPPALLNHWLLYIKFDNDTFWDHKTKQNISATTYLEPENGDPPILINGSHTLLVLLWQIPTINKIWGFFNRLRRYTDEKINVSFPWSFEKWRFKNFLNWGVVKYLEFLPESIRYSLPIPIGLIESMFIIMNWPYNIWTSILNFKYASEIFGMASFIIWNNSTAIP